MTFPIGPYDRVEYYLIRYNFGNDLAAACARCLELKRPKPYWARSFLLGIGHRLLCHEHAKEAGPDGFPKRVRGP